MSCAVARNVQLRHGGSLFQPLLTVNTCSHGMGASAAPLTLVTWGVQQIYKGDQHSECCSHLAPSDATAHKLGALLTGQNSASARRKYSQDNDGNKARMHAVHRPKLPPGLPHHNLKWDENSVVQRHVSAQRGSRPADASRLHSAPQFTCTCTQIVARSCWWGPGQQELSLLA